MATGSQVTRLWNENSIEIMRAREEMKIVNLQVRQFHVYTKNKDQSLVSLF